MSNYPTVRPSLTLDFQKSKQLDPRISFSRSSSATYVEGGVVKTADEHQARFEEEGLLIEESRVNVVKKNTTGSDAGWEYGEESTDVQPPTGGTNSVRKGPSLRFKNNNLTPPSSGNYHAWITYFVNTASWSRFAFRTVTNGYYYFFFDLSGPTPRVEEKHGNTLITDVNPNKYICQQLANGWWRIGYRTWNSPYLGYRQLWRFDRDANDEPIVNNGWPGGAPANTFIYAWGGQMEIGTKASSFIPNNGTNSITRAADVCTIAGDNFSSWYNQGEGTIFAEFSGQTYATANAARILSFADSASTSMSAGNGILFGSHTGSIQEQRWRVRGTTITGFNIPTFVVKKTALAYAPNDLARVDNGINLQTSTNSPPTVVLNQMHIFPMNTSIARLSYYSERLTDTQLEAITS